MIITQLSITNFGVYKGVNDFELRPRKVDGEFLPVILFGGKNGSGKTTILESIRLCLYGKLALGTRVRRTDYDTYIVQRIHRGSANRLPAQAASVGLVFEHVHAGILSRYDAVRSWRIDGQSLSENLSIYKDGQPLRDIPTEHWDDFLRDLIPPGVSDLFFFDGEQIQALADEETETSALATAMNGLLNLDLVERLKADLTLYVKQQEKKERSNLQKATEAIETQYAQVDAIYAERNQDRAGLRTQLERTKKLVEDARQALLREGAGFVENRTSLELRQHDIEKQIEQTRNAIRDLAAELMPFAVAPKWSMKLAAKLQSEERHEQDIISYHAKLQQAAEIASLLTDKDFQEAAAPKVSKKVWQQIVNALQQRFQPNKPVETPILHNLSAQGRKQLQGWIEKSLNDIPALMRDLGQKLEELETERSKITRSLSQIPSDAVAYPLLEQFHVLSETKGMLQQQIETIDEEINQLDLKRTDLDRQRRKVWQELASLGDTDNRVELAAKVQVILDAYLERITKTKTRELEKMVAHFFNLLCRKDMLVKEVIIDAKRYTVTLYAENRTELPKSSLSAGERQLYAMALLWALRSVSGRMLPIIVDTPMGRLDTDHRRTLLKYFFPTASHQLILLSTDTEVDEEAYMVLKPAISHVFLLNYDNDTNSTVAERRYFADEMEAQP